MCINISKDTGLPKETARRKINGLIANKTLNKHTIVHKSLYAPNLIL